MYSRPNWKGLISSRTSWTHSEESRMPAAPRTGTRRRAGSRPAGRQSAKQAKENPLALVEDITDIEITDLVTAKFTKNIVIHGPSGHGKTILAGGVTRDYKAT